MHKGKVLPFSSQLMGFLKWLGPVPSYFWRGQRDVIAADMHTALVQLTTDQHRAYRLAVSRLTETGVPLEIVDAAARLNLTIDRTGEIMEELEKRTSLVRHHTDGSITAAYPITLGKSGVRLILDSGEEMGAESPLDALALACVVGRLRGKDVSGHFTTDCAFCRKPLHIMIGSGLSLKWLENDVSPRLFLPLATAKTGVEGILFCLNNAVGYCSPGHAGEHRSKTGGARGYYLTPETAADLMMRLVEVILPLEVKPL